MLISLFTFPFLFTFPSLSSNPFLYTEKMKFLFLYKREILFRNI